MSEDERLRRSARDERAQGEISVAQIEQMVHQFYARVREDALLGPVFARHIERWPPHLERMVLFWRAVLRSERLFGMSPRGGPQALHQAIEALQIAHFERWLTLFAEVVDEIYAPAVAAQVKSAAARSARALSRHLSPTLQLPDAYG